MTSLNNNPILIVGMGRSGTNFTGRLLAAHPDIKATIEKKTLLQNSDAIALQTEDSAQAFTALVDEYHELIKQAYPNRYCDKSHPTLWCVKELQEALPNAAFIGVSRNPYGSIASMLKHQGVLSWFYKYQQYRIPNRYLGITSAIAENYDALPLVKKCAYRWKSNHDEMIRLQKDSSLNLYVAQYEKLIMETSDELQKLKSFLSLDRDIPLPNVDHSPLSKWKNELSQDDVTVIMEITQVPPPE